MGGWSKSAIGTVAAAVALAIAGVAFGVGVLVANDSQESPPTTTEASTTTTSRITSTTATTTTAPATTVAPTTTTTIPPTTTTTIQVVGDEGVAPNIEPEPISCVTGSVEVASIKVTPGEYEDTYEVTAVFRNDTDVVWDMYGARLYVSIAEYPDRVADYFDVWPTVNEVRPGESMPLHGEFSLYPSGTEMGRVWWDPEAIAEDQYVLSAYPRVPEPWAIC